MARDRSYTYKDGGLRGGETKASFGDDDAAGDVMTGNGERASAGCCRAAGVGVEAEVEAAEGGGRMGVRAASSSVSGRSACCIPRITGVWLSFATVQHEYNICAATRSRLTFLQHVDDVVV